MKKSLIHLPQYKRDELKRIVNIIRRQFPSAHMIVLFGSYARGQWVEDTYTEAHITYEYISDFDILVLTRLKKTANNHSKQSTVDNLIIRHKAIKTPVSVIYHSVGQVNYRLKEGRYFFSDIKKEGILLYDSGKVKLAKICKPGPKKRPRLLAKIQSPPKVTPEFSPGHALDDLVYHRPDCVDILLGCSALPESLKMV